MTIVEQGRGQPLVLIPGLQGRWEYLRPTIDALAGDFHVNVAHPRTMRIQEMHLTVVHCLCEVVDNTIYGEKK